MEQKKARAFGIERRIEDPMEKEEVFIEAIRIEYLEFLYNSSECNLVEIEDTVRVFSEGADYPKCSLKQTIMDQLKYLPAFALFRLDSPECPLNVKFDCRTRYSDIIGQFRDFTGEIKEIYSINSLKNLKVGLGLEGVLTKMGAGYKFDSIRPDLMNRDFKGNPEDFTIASAEYDFDKYGPVFSMNEKEKLERAIEVFGEDNIRVLAPANKWIIGKNIDESAYKKDSTVNLLHYPPNYRVIFGVHKHRIKNYESIFLVSERGDKRELTEYLDNMKAKKRHYRTPLSFLKHFYGGT